MVRVIDFSEQILEVKSRTGYTGLRGYKKVFRINIFEADPFTYYKYSQDFKSKRAAMDFIDIEKRRFERMGIKYKVQI